MFVYMFILNSLALAFMLLLPASHHCPLQCFTLCYFYYHFIVSMQVESGIWCLESGVWEELLNANAIYRKRFDNMFAGIFIISAFMWFPLELQAN